MKFLKLHYFNGERVLVNPVTVKFINETESQQYGVCSLIDFMGTAQQLLVKESIDEIQFQMDDSGDVSKTRKDS